MVGKAKSPQAERSPASGKTRRRAAHLGPQRRRPQVLDAALELFVERGYRDTSIEAIADRVGVTKPVVYECYPSKNALFIALLDREEERLREHIFSALPTQPPEDLEAVLVRAFEAVLSAALTAPDSWRVVFISQHGHDPVIADRVQSARDQVVTRVESLAEAVLRENGVADAPRIATIAAELLVSAGEAGVRLVLEPDRESDPRELGALIGRLAAGGAREVIEG